MKNCQMIPLIKIHDTRGDLTFAENWNPVPFEIKRSYWMYNIPDGETRAGHAHKTLRQLLVALSGSFRVVLCDGVDKAEYLLSAPDMGLYISPMVWREIVDFSSNAVCMALASSPYDESDYIRDYDQFLKESHVKSR